MNSFNFKLESDMLNQSFGSVKDFYKCRKIVLEKKRKSIFDGVDVSNEKKQKLLQDNNDNNDDQVNETLSEQDPFLLKFDCKHCPSQFTKFGQFRTHTDKIHSPKHNNNETNGTVVIQPDTQVSQKEGKYTEHCLKCSQYVINENYKKPFSPRLHKSLLVEMNIDFQQMPGYKTVSKKVPAIRPRNVLKLGGEEFIVGELKGEGGFAKVFSATWSNCPRGVEDVVLKVQKPSNDWEWYLLNEVQLRLKNLNHPDLGSGSAWCHSFMSGSRCLTFQDGSVIVSQLNKYGTILDMINATNSADKDLVEPLAVYMTAEILGMVDILHSIDIIHGDLKPDNLMLTDIPGGSNKNCIQMIDFGKAIDLKCFPENVYFDEFVKTSGLITVEMREKRPYRHHIDYFGIAAISYCLLFGQYIQIKKSNDRWAPKTNFKRWWNVEFWKLFFDEFLNLSVVDRKCMPSLISWRKKFLELFDQQNMKVGVEKARSFLQRKMASNRRRTM